MCATPQNLNQGNEEGTTANSNDSNSIRKKKIGIIGAGVSGLATAKAFSAKGHEVFGFERSGTIGGVWDFERSYPGVKTQSSKDLYRFTDLPMPQEYPEWPSGEQVFSYLQSYAEKHSLLQMFSFGSSVKSIEKRNDGNNGWVLTIEETSKNADEKKGVHVYTMTFDFVVVCTGTFTNPHTLVHPGQDKLTNAGGLVKHSSEYRDMGIRSDIEGKRVMIIGGSKSATDIAVHAAKEGRAQQVILLYRRNVWRIPYFIGGINFKHLLYMRAQEIQFTDSWNVNTDTGVDVHGTTPSISTSSPAPSFLSSIASFVKKKLYWANFRVLEGLLNAQLGLRRKGMLPKEKIEDAVSCSIPVVTEGLMQCIDDGSIRPIHSTLKCYEVTNDEASPTNTNTTSIGESQIYAILDNGEKIEIDDVIQATGWTMDLPFLSCDLKEKLIDDSDGLYRLYRFAVNPDIPNLGFVGFNSSFCTVLSSEMIANWLVRYADGMLAPNGDKTKDEMRDDIERMLDWKRRVRPAASVYGGNCVAPFHFHHFDEILKDVGATLTDDSMFGYPKAEKFGEYLESAPKYKVHDK